MTSKKKPKVYITRKLPDIVETRMRELFDAELNLVAWSVLLAIVLIAGPR